jgi:hypothetical protein
MLVTNPIHVKLKIKNREPVKNENKPVLYPVAIIMNHGTKAIQARELIHGEGNENEKRRIVRKERKRFT